MATAVTAGAALALAACGGDPASSDVEGAAATTATTTTPASTVGPLERSVADAAEVAAERVQCGDEDLESAIGEGGTCAVAGTRYVVADSGKKLRLDSLSARLTRLETRRRVSGGYRKPRTSRRGVYAIGTLSVRNDSKRVRRFDDFGEQVRLKVADSTYREAFNVLNGVATASFLWRAKEIKPGRSEVGKVVFDVPRRAAKRLRGDGGLLLVLNFADEGSWQRAAQIGVIRTPR